jgi:hypothetical protein
MVTCRSIGGQAPVGWDAGYLVDLVPSPTMCRTAFFSESALD